ncbi:5369_t:CDS:2 [Dentiscutata erythropus]|uniref:5369_t:CDS:1 n=1 Tax=Dentiscutata erythropus TaxID=1348616 RepID=A0A9N9I320_9GLOM|nr:5369_t:CDS:2 [Dentiscutata erythropus]
MEGLKNKIKLYGIQVEKCVFLKAGEAKTIIDSHYAQWQWPTKGKFAGCILAHAISNIGNWNIFSSTDLEKVYKKDIPKLNPEISTHTTPCSD